MACVPTPSRLGTFSRGERLPCLISFLVLHFLEGPGELIMRRLTAAKEDGATIEIGGKKVALGIPGAKVATTPGVPDRKAFSTIPLARPGTADEAAASMLLCVCFTFTRPIGGHSPMDFGWRSLASPLASYVTGHTLEVTGGR